LVLCKHKLILLILDCFIACKFFSFDLIKFVYSAPRSEVVNKPMPFAITLNDQQSTKQDIPYWYYEAPSVYELNPDRGPDTGNNNSIHVNQI
jgi:hypothetical protein